jgi:hypothetical protein
VRRAQPTLDRETPAPGAPSSTPTPAPQPSTSDEARAADVGAALTTPIARYSFTGGQEATVADGITPPLSLSILPVTEGALTTAWAPDGLLVTEPSLVRSAGAATKIITALTASSELTVEAWISPANIEQAGPARIVEVSTGVGEKPTFVLGQVGAAYIFRTTISGTIQPLTGGTATTAITHLVATRSADGARQIRVNGETAVSDSHPGTLDTVALAPLTIANEGNGARSWLGKVFVVAIYDRALAPAEIAARFAAGPK